MNDKVKISDELTTVDKESVYRLPELPFDSVQDSIHLRSEGSRHLVSKETPETAEATGQSVHNFSKVIHNDLSYQSMRLANSMFLKWSDREDDEKVQRGKAIKYITYFILVQFIIALTFLSFVVVGLIAYENSTLILVSFFGAIILEFIGLLVIVMKYLYNERTTSGLKIVAEIIRDAGNNNRGYFNNESKIETISDDKSQ